MNKMFGSFPSQLHSEMFPLHLGFWPKQHILWNFWFFWRKFLRSSLVENWQSPVNYIFLYISPLKYLNLVLIPGVKMDNHRGTWTDCIKQYDANMWIIEAFVKIFLKRLVIFCFNNSILFLHILFDLVILLDRIRI